MPKMPQKNTKKDNKDQKESKQLDINAILEAENHDPNVTYRPLTWVPLSEAFFDAVKLPGLPEGYFVSFRGYSNTGKSTAMYEAIVGCQKLGKLAVIFETEGNWNWEHAKNIGVELEEMVDEDTGEILYKPKNFILKQGMDLLNMYKTFDHAAGKNTTKELRYEPVVEDIAKYMHHILDMVEEGKIQQDVVFLWDSVGSLNCFRGATSSTSNNQWTAGALSNSFKSLINFRIPSSRRTDSKQLVTFAVVQQIWLDNENKVIKHKGGETFFYAPRLIFHFGGILSHSAEKLKATYNSENYEFGIVTPIRCEKNQVNGITQKGKIASTPHGYWNPDKIDEYKTIHKDHIKAQLNTEFDDFVITKEESDEKES